MAATIAVSVFIPMRASAADVWLAAVDPIVGKVVPGASADYMDLFEPSAAWPVASSHVRIFKISTQFAYLGSEEDLRRIFADLRRRHVALAMETLILPRRGRCGAHPADYEYPLAKVATRIADLGGDLQFIAMDEPLYHGHRYRGPNSCSGTIDEIAGEVAGNVGAIKRIFPKVRVGDIEPSGADADWVDEVTQWMVAYQLASGEPLEFIHLDVNWMNRWEENVSHLATLIRTRGTHFGVIYNGNPNDESGMVWNQHAEERFNRIEGRLGIHPDDAVLQTWMRYPNHLLPEDQEGTLTNLVLQYVKQMPVLTVEVTRGHVLGRLTDQSGHPIAGADVTVSATDNLGVGPPTIRQVSGHAPANASRVLVALRINTECYCAGTAVFAMGKRRFAQPSIGEATFPPFPIETGATSDGATSVVGRPIGVNATQRMALNSKTVTVVPGELFKFEVPLQARAGSQRSGYIALIFQNAEGAEVRRDKIWLEPSEVQLAIVKTDDKGHFDLTKNNLPNSAGIEAHLSGDTYFRSAWGSSSGQ